MHDTLLSCETIAETYRQRSEASVNFSIMMGRIDEKARKEDILQAEEHEEVRCLSDALNEGRGLCNELTVILWELVHIFSSPIGIIEHEWCPKHQHLESWFVQLKFVSNLV